MPIVIIILALYTVHYSLFLLYTVIKSIFIKTENAFYPSETARILLRLLLLLPRSDVLIKTLRKQYFLSLDESSAIYVVSFFSDERSDCVAHFSDLISPSVIFSLCRPQDVSTAH